MFKPNEVVRFKELKILKLLGKGGYSYLVENKDKQPLVLKQIHHKPYNFSNKIEAEINDYKN